MFSSVAVCCITQKCFKSGGCFIHVYRVSEWYKIVTGELAYCAVEGDIMAQTSLCCNNFLNQKPHIYSCTCTSVCGCIHSMYRISG